MVAFIHMSFFSQEFSAFCRLSPSPSLGSETGQLIEVTVDSQCVDNVQDPFAVISRRGMYQRIAIFPGHPIFGIV